MLGKEFLELKQDVDSGILHIKKVYADETKLCQILSLKT